MKLIKCATCGELKFHHAKGLCYSCYKKQWKPKLIVCKNCGKKKPHKAFGLCEVCHTKLYHYDKIKKYQNKKPKCAACGSSLLLKPYFIGLPSDFIFLCPNCHAMINSLDHKTKIIEKLKVKGYEI